MKIKIPSLEEVLNRRSWTGYSLRELVESGRVKPNEGAKNWILAEQKKAFDEGFILPYDKIGEYVKIWEQLEYEVLDALVMVQEKSE